MYNCVEISKIILISILSLSVILIIITLYCSFYNENYKQNDKQNDKQNLLIHKCSGGLTHMLCTTNHSISLAKKYKKDLIIDSKKHAAFDGDFFNYFNIPSNEINVIKKYPKNILWEKVPLEEIEDAAWENKNNKYALVLKDKKVPFDKKIKRKGIQLVTFNGYTYDNYVRLNRNILESLEEKSKDLKNVEYIGVHYRNSDIKNNYDEILKDINKKIEKSGISTVYLATDDYYAFDKFNKDVKGKVIRKTFPKKLEKGEINIHYHTKDKSKVVNECLLDMYILKNSKIFIPSNNSSLSRYISHMRKNPKKTIFYM